VIIAPPAERPAIEALLAQLEMDVAEFRSLKGLAKITYHNNGDRKAANHVVIAESPEQLRLETLSLFGAPLMLAATDGRHATVLLPGEGRAYTGSAEAGFLRQVTRLPLTTKMVVSILLRRPDLLPARQVSINHLPEGINRLTLTAGRLAQEVDYDSRRQLVRVAYRADDQFVSVINYAVYEEGFPQEISIEMPERAVNVTLDFSDIETNVALDGTLFRLIPSSAYRVEPFPDL
jgi:hypothetical protein